MSQPLLLPAGVDRECGWVWCSELLDRHGGLSAGSTLRVHRIQVSAVPSDGLPLFPTIFTQLSFTGSLRQV